MSQITEDLDTRNHADAWRVLAQAETAEQLYAAWLAVLCRALSDARAGLVLLAQPDGSFAPVAALPAARDLSYLSEIATEALRQREGVVRHDELGHARLAYPLLMQEQLHGAVVLDLGSAAPAGAGARAAPDALGRGLADRPAATSRTCSCSRAAQAQGALPARHAAGAAGRAQPARGGAGAGQPHRPRIRLPPGAARPGQGQDAEAAGGSRMPPGSTNVPASSTWRCRPCTRPSTSASASSGRRRRTRARAWPWRTGAMPTRPALPRCARCRWATRTAQVGVLMLERDRPFTADDLDYLRHAGAQPGAGAGAQARGRTGRRGARAAHRRGAALGLATDSSHPALEAGPGRGRGADACCWR